MRDLTPEQNDVFAEVALDIEERLAAEDTATVSEKGDEAPN